MRKLLRKASIIYALRRQQIDSMWNLVSNRSNNYLLQNAKFLEDASAIVDGYLARCDRLLLRSKELDDAYTEINLELSRRFFFNRRAKKLLRDFIEKHGNHEPGWDDIDSSI